MRNPEQARGELTPFDHNDRLRRIYGMIQPLPPSAIIQMKPDALDPILRLPTIPLQEEESPRTVFLSNIWDEDSIRRNHVEKDKRSHSASLRMLKSQLISELRDYGHMTQPANFVVVSQFEDDFKNGQRPFDDLHGFGGERIGSYFLLEYPADYIPKRGKYDEPLPRREGVFSADAQHVKAIERELYGQYLDWCEIGGFEEKIQMVHEMPLLKRWNLAYKEKYKEAPYPNLE